MKTRWATKEYIKVLKYAHKTYQEMREKNFSIYASGGFKEYAFLAQAEYWRGRAESIEAIFNDFGWSLTE